MSKINNINQLKIDESYLIFVGYDHSQSGYDIGTYNLAGNFEMQSNGSVISYAEHMQVFTLPTGIINQQTTTNEFAKM